jgi:hypothetical protein
LQQRRTLTGCTQPFTTQALPFQVFVRALQYMHHVAVVNSTT